MNYANGGTENKVLEQLTKHFTLSDELVNMAYRIEDNINNVIRCDKSSYEYKKRFNKFLAIRLNSLLAFYKSPKIEFGNLKSYLFSICSNHFISYVDFFEIEDFISGFLANEIRKYRKRYSLKGNSRLIDAELLSYCSVFSRVKIPSLGGLNVFRVRYSKAISENSRRKPILFDFTVIDGIDKTKQNDLSLIFEISQRTSTTENESVWKDVYVSLLDYLKNTPFKSSTPELVSDYTESYVSGVSTREFASKHAMTMRRAGHLQEKVRYHVDKFSVSKGRDIVNDWLNVGLDNSLGMLPSEYQYFIDSLDDRETKVFKMYKKGETLDKIATALNISEYKAGNCLEKILLKAKKIRNGNKGNG